MRGSETEAEREGGKEKDRHELLRMSKRERRGVLQRRRGG